MASIAGKKARIKVGTSGAGPFNVVAGLKSSNHSIEGTNIDISEIGIDYIQRIQGLKDGKLSLAGNLKTLDATGQAVIKAALMNDSTLVVQILPDGGTTANLGCQQDMKVSKWAVDAAVDGAVGLSIELEGNGAITSV